jgi:DNA ligase-associated metallophosphoesterase
MASWLDLSFAGHDLVLDAGLALYWPARDALVVSDLHLEKSTFLAQFGSTIAPFDSHDTLARLTALVARYRPKSLILLGDSFHDHGAWERLDARAREQLLALCAAVDDCCFIEGNHDRNLALPDCLCFEDERTTAGLVFRHEPGVSGLPQVIGHFHPALSFSLRGHRLRGKCFAVNGHTLIMPSFGSFTGGLDLRDPAFRAIDGGDPFQPYLVYKNTVTAVRFSLDAR